MQKDHTAYKAVLGVAKDVLGGGEGGVGVTTVGFVVGSVSGQEAAAYQ